MSRPIVYMAAFGLIALIAVTFTFLRGGPSLEPSGGNGGLPGLPVKPIGNTAISHGGPTPARTEGDSLPEAAAPIALGDRVLIGTAPGPGGGPPAPVALLAAVPESEPPVTTGIVASVSPGTVGIVVAIAPAVPPDTRQSETYYKVQLPNGLAGWVPERILHVAVPPAGGEVYR